VEIDYCPQCQGSWLDRGEVGKIIEREMAAYGPLPAQQRQAAAHPKPFVRYDRPVERSYNDRRDNQRGYYSDDRRRYDDDDDDDQDRGRKKKRESFLSDLATFRAGADGGGGGGGGGAPPPPPPPARGSIRCR